VEALKHEVVRLDYENSIGGKDVPDSSVNLPGSLGWVESHSLPS